MMDQARAWGPAATQWRCDANNPTIVTVWNDRYCTDAAPTNSTSKQALVMRMALDEGLLEVRSVPFDAEAAWADIATVHERGYVDAVRSGSPRYLAESQGFHWSPEQADAVVRIWAGHASACRLALENGMVFHPVSGAHHAGAARGSGFCTFNFLAGAARAMLRERRMCVAVVDLDAHPGNGTYELEAGNACVALFDIAGAPWTSVQNNARVEYHVAGDAGAYHTALDRLPGFLDRVRPDLVQYQAGMDPYDADPVGGIEGVDETFLRWRDAFVVEHVTQRRIPMVVNLAGGYVRGVSERLHLNTLRVMAESARACDPAATR
jgi:acetoin utilization deacetylase AcuC-like enzyme